MRPIVLLCCDVTTHISTYVPMLRCYDVIPMVWSTARQGRGCVNLVPTVDAQRIFNIDNNTINTPGS